MGKKNRVPVYDMEMSTHWGACLKADALFGIKVKGKLAWPPAQIDGDNTVERAPSVNCRHLSAVTHMNAYEVANASSPTGFSPAIGEDHKEIMTAMRAEHIDEPELFGGDTGTGGVRGLFTWLPGRDDQILPEWITSRLEMDQDKCPSYRGIASAFFSGLWKGEEIADQNGIRKAGSRLISALSRLTKKKTGFVWGTSDPYVPTASLRVFRRPDAPPLRDWARYYLNPFNLDGFDQGMTTVIETPRSPARRKTNEDDGQFDDEDMLPQGGGFPSANPAAVIYELLASASYDVAAGDGSMDADSFLLAARLLSREKLGISFAWIDQDTVKSVVEDICEHIGGAVFIHPSTHLWTLRLLRPDNDFYGLTFPNETISLPWITGFVLDPSNARLDGDVERKGWSDLVNWITVKYTNDETSKEQSTTIQAQDLISFAGGKINDATLNYWMFRSEQSAISAGERQLSVAGKPLMKASWIVDRSGWAIAPYDVITVNWPSEGLVNARFRVLAVDYGNSKDRQIKIDAIEDVFAETVKRTAIAPQTPLWTPEARPSMAAPYHTPASAPLLLGNGITPEQLAELDESGDAVMMHLLSSKRALTGADAWVKTVAEPFPSQGQLVDSTPRAELIEPLPAEATTTINFYDLDWGSQERDPEPDDVLVIVRRRADKPALDRYWTTITGGRLRAVQLPGAPYGDTVRSVLHWGVGTAAMALDPDSGRSAELNGLAPAFHEEVCVIRSVNRETGNVTLTRGAFDTVPAPVPAGSWVYHLTGVPPVPREASPDDATMTAVYRPRNASGAARSTTQQYTYVATARQEMPARPGNVRLTVGAETFGISSKAVLDEPVDVTVRWASRNRLLDDASPALWTAGNITPEAGQSHYVRVWRRVRRNAAGDAPAVLVAQFYDLGGDSFVLPAAVFENSLTDADWNAGNVATDIPNGGAFVVEVGAQRLVSGTRLGRLGNDPAGAVGDAVAEISAQAALMLVDVGTTPAGWGMDWGNNWGG